MVLSVTLRLGDDTLEVHTATMSLGSWLITEVRISQLDSGIFSLQLGSDRALFAAADPLGFAYETTRPSPGRHLRSLVGERHEVSAG